MKNEQLLQVLKIQLDTLGELETVKTFLHIQAKFYLLTNLINSENNQNEQIQTSGTN